MSGRIAARIAVATIEAAPGDTATVRVSLSSSAGADDAASSVTVRAIGFDDDVERVSTGPRTTAPAPGPAPLSLVIEPGATEICEVPVTVPATVAAGRHNIAVEVVEAGERPQLITATLAVASVRRVELVPTPSPVRGRRRAKFYVDVINHEPTTVEFDLTGEARDVSVKFDCARFRLEPGERATTKAKTKGPRLWRGEPIQHNLLLTARSAASSSTATAPFVQRPVFVRGARAAVAALALIAIWIAGIVGLFWWLGQRGADAEFAFGGDVVGVDSDGDGVADRFYNASGDPVATPDGVDTDGDGVVDSFTDSSGKAVETLTAVDTDGDGNADVFLDETGRAVPDPSTGVDGTGTPDEIASSVDPSDLADDGTLASADGSGSGSGDGADSGDVALPSATDVGGTVKAPGTDDLSGLSVTLTPIGSDDARVPSGTSAGVTKYWPVRTIRSFDADGTVRQSETVSPLVVAPDADGVWQFTDVELRRSYELSFAGPGYDTYATLLTPPDDGSPVSLDVELTPAIGALRGRVSGPGGELGGAAITVSDGRTTFTTTADTEGDPGSFRIDGLSTPGAYTMTTELDGYATDVRQVDLGPGEQANGVQIVLERGVATVTGRITDTTGRALPGASITASNGVDQRSTSSFTAGDLGAYSLPQLTIGTTYTISVDLDGYGTQTRRVPVNGSIGGVNIVLAPTSSTISGTVASSSGGGIVGAGVILQNGDLEFRTSTAETPAGSFEVADLPAGSYTVTIEHFEHETSTQFVDVVAGTNPPPLDVTLQRLDGVPSVGVGELVVEVVDPDAETADERQISGATVTITRARTGEVERQVTQDEFDFRITDIPVGTYTLTAEAAGYAPSAPRQVSIGLQAERREVELQKLGAARGRVVDALTKQPVTDGYALELFIVTPEGNLIPANRTLIGQTDGTWQTEPRELPPGEYLLQPSNPPIGYEILSDQRIDPEANGLMRFTLTGDLEEPKDVGDIEADPYPDIRGRVLTPRLVGAVTELDPIDSNSLNAVLSCDGVSATLTGQLLDNAGTQSTTTPLYDEFFFDFKEVDRNDLVGTCRVAVTADGFVGGSVDLPNLAVSDGFVDPDRTANVALSAGTDSFGGQVFWIDPRGSVQVPLDGVAFSTRAITRIDPAEGSGGLPGVDPDPVLTDLSSTSALGVWALDGHIFGASTYNLSAANFSAASMEVAIDETGNRTVSSPSNLEIAPTSAPITSNTSYDIRLLQPADGEIAGRVNILTTETPEFGAVTLAAVEPDGDPFTGTITPLTPVPGPVIPPAPHVATFTVPDVDAGTWDVNVATVPDNHIVYSGASLTMTERVDPGETESRFATTLVDLGMVEVRLVDATTSQPITTPANLTLTALSGNGADQTINSTGAATGIHLFEDVVVDADNPTTVLANYQLAISVPGYDPVTAQITATPTGTAINLADIRLALLAGSDITVTATLQPYGSIIAEIVGNTQSGFEELAVAPAGDATVVVRDAGTATPNPNVLVRPFAGGTTGQFEVTGPPGTYEFDVAHPEFGAPTLVPVDASGTLSVPSGRYILRNGFTNTLTGRFELPIRRVSLEVTAFEEIGGTQITDLEVTLSNGPIAVTPVSTTTGTATVTNLVPGTYDVTVRSYDGATTDQDQFPFITSITVRRSETANVNTTTQLTAVMPAVRAGIDLVVQAHNSRDELVDLPVVDVTRTYTPPAAGALTDDQGGAVESPTSAGRTETQTTSAGPSPQTLQFRDLVAIGSGHVFSFESAAGYTAPAPLSVTVTAATGVFDVPNPVTYEVDDVTAQFAVTATPPGGDFVDLRAELISLGGIRYPCTLVDPPPTGSWSFNCAGVPAGVPYEVELLDSLYQPTAPTTLPRVNVPVYTGTDTPPAELFVTATEVTPGDLSLTTANRRVNIFVENDDGVRVDPVTIQLDPGGTAAALPMTRIDVGEYRLDVTERDYLLEVESGRNNTSVSQNISVGPGTTFTDTVTLRRLATVTVNVSPAPPVGTTIDMQNDGGDVFISDNTASPFTFYVPRNDDYRVRVNGTYPLTYDPASNYFRIGRNATQVTRNVTLPRRIDVVVANATAATQVELTSPDGLTSYAGPQTAPFSFSSATSSTLPTTGAVRVVVTDPSRQTEVATAPDALSSTVNVSVRPLISIVGVLTTSDDVVIPSGTSIQADEVNSSFGNIANGETFTGTVGANNQYSIPGLSATIDAPPNDRRFFRVSFGLDGVGRGLANLTIDRTTGASVTVDFTVVPELRDITITVVDNNGAAVDGALVTIEDGPLTAIPGSPPTGFTQSATTPSPGQLAGVVRFVDIRETLDLDVFVVAPAGSGLEDGSGAIAPGPADVNLLVPLAAV